MTDHWTPRLAAASVLLLLPAVVPGPAVAAPGDVTRMSVATSGEQGNSGSAGAALSASGRFVAFESSAFNLVAGDTNGQSDVFVRDRQTGVTERVSVANGGEQLSQRSDVPAISADGRLVAFVTLDVGGNLVRVRDRQAGTTTPEPGIESGVSRVSMTPNGRYLTFGARRGGVSLWDRQAGTTVEVGVTPAGAPGNGASSRPALSDDGRFVAFESTSTDLVAGDTNGTTDVFVRDLQAGTTVRASVSGGASPEQGNGASTGAAITGDGRLVFFVSSSFNLVAGDVNGATDVFVRDLQATTTVREPGTESTGFLLGDTLSVTPDGRLLGFQTSNGGSVVRDRQAGTTTPVGVAAGGTRGLGFNLDISDDGSVVGFHSSSALVSGDTNGASDVFVQELAAAAPPPPAGGSTTAQQATTVTVTGPPADLSIAVAQPAVAFPSLVAGATTPEVAVGTITYTNSKPVGTPWSATVAATSLVSGSGTIGFANLTFTPGALGPPLTAGGAGAFSGPDTVPGTTYSAPRTLMTATADARGTFPHTGSTVRLAVPAGTPSGAYAGKLQYTVTG